MNLKAEIKSIKKYAKKMQIKNSEIRFNFNNINCCLTKHIVLNKTYYTLACCNIKTRFLDSFIAFDLESVNEKLYLINENFFVKGLNKK